MSDYKPGTVAMVTTANDDETPVLAFRDGDKGVTGWSLADYRRGSIWLSDEYVTDVRPLVVLDLSPHDIMRTLEALRASRGLIALQVADKLEAATRPPKPDEPTGLGAVVECEYDGHKGTATAIRPGQWVFATDGFIDYSPYWDAFDAVSVLSEGVRP